MAEATIATHNSGLVKSLIDLEEGLLDPVGLRLRLNQRAALALPPHLGQSQRPAQPRARPSQLPLRRNPAQAGKCPSRGYS
ncbi:hypothetical protein ACO1MS_14290, partial [Staphylococcus aureus]